MCIYVYVYIYIYTYQSLWKWRPIKSPIEIEIPFNPTTSPLNPGPASEFDVTLSLPPWQGEKELQISAPGNVGPWDAMRTTKNSGLKPLFPTYLHIFTYVYIYIFLFNVCHSKNSPKHNMSKCKMSKPGSSNSIAPTIFALWVRPNC